MQRLEELAVQGEDVAAELAVAADSRCSSSPWGSRASSWSHSSNISLVSRWSCLILVPKSIWQTGRATTSGQPRRIARQASHKIPGLFRNHDLLSLNALSKRSQMVMPWS
jgi:hypothetical protein